MSSEKQKKVADNSGAVTAQAKDEKPETRRRVIKAGIIAVPVLLTLRGKPAKAQTTSAGSADSDL